MLCVFPIKEFVSEAEWQQQRAIVIKRKKIISTLNNIQLEGAGVVMRFLSFNTKPNQPTQGRRWHETMLLGERERDTYEWYCACRKLNSSLIRSSVSAMVNFSGPWGGGPCN